MNLYELDELIQILIDENIPENDALIKLYLKKRKELVAEIMKDLENIL